LYCKAILNFVAGLGSWLDFSSHWGHNLASPAHPKLQVPINGHN
jgi:hypothetical protein